MPEPRSLDDTVAALESVVARCAADDDRVGYFAAMYVAVTATVRQRAADGFFGDGRRMELFVARFAGRYLDAHDAWRAGEVERERGRGVVQVKVRAFWMWVRRKGGNLGAC